MTTERERAAGRVARGDQVLRVRLFASSYAPLLLILALRFSDGRLAAGCLALGVLGFVDTWLLTRAAQSIAATAYQVSRVVDNTGAISGYLASYLLPFVAVPDPTARELASYIAFFVIAGIIHFRGDLVEANPTLLLFGFRLFKVTVNDTWTAYMLSRTDLPPGKPVQAARIRDRLLVRVDHGRDDEWRD